MFDIFDPIAVASDISIDLDYVVFPLLTLILTWLGIKLTIALVARQISRIDSVIATGIAKQLLSLKAWTPLVTGLYLAAFVVPEPNFTVILITKTLFLLAWVWEALDLAFAVINSGVERVVLSSGDATNSASYRLVGAIIKVLICSLVILMVLANLGLDVSSLIAGLGISGIAIALAIQAVLGDLISSISLVTDKPFRVGDFIVVDGHKGKVEDVGIRSTRLRSLTGDLIIIPNSNLTKSVIHNFGQGREFSHEHSIKVSTNIEGKLLQDIPTFVTEILLANKHVDKDDYRVNLTNLAAGSAEFTIAYQVIAADYEALLAVQEEIMFAIHGKFSQEGISFA